MRKVDIITTINNEEFVNLQVLEEVTNYSFARAVGVCLTDTPNLKFFSVGLYNESIIEINLYNPYLQRFVQFNYYFKLEVFYQDSFNVSSALKLIKSISDRIYNT